MTTASRRGLAAQPPVPRVATARAFAKGQGVVITDGMSKGLRGVIVERWHDLGGAPAWRVDLPDCRDRIIRADFLEAVPA